jgi:HEAT repeat protein
VKFVPNGTWQQVSYNLAAALPGSQGRRFVTDISFGDPRRFAENHSRSHDVNTHFIDDFKISPSPAANAVTEDADAEVEPVGDLRSADPYLRALGAAKATGTPQELSAMRAVLTDPDNIVRTNVAAAFARFKDAESVPALITAARMERVPYPAVMMVHALAFQDTLEAWSTLEAILRQGRAEEMSLAEAAKLMGNTRKPEFIDDISVMLTATNWQARQAGAYSLGLIGTEPSQLMLLTFLLEVDPMVRMQGAKSADANVDLVARRMEWASINDLSNVVKGHSYGSLTLAADPLRRSRGYAGLKEEDPEIRRIIAERMRQRPEESHVTPLLGLLSDPYPAVRAEAVQTLMAMPGTRSFSEMSVLAGENDDFVLYALLDAARQRKVELPRAMLERLAGHRNPLIRDRVKELIG